MKKKTLNQNRNNIISLLTVNVRFIRSKKNNSYYLSINKFFSEPELMKIIIDSALKQKSIILTPIFNNKLIALSKLVEMGLMYKQEDKYYFTF